MRKYNFISVGILWVALLIGCKGNSSGKQNGWYHSPDGIETAGEPIFTQHDIDSIYMDSLYLHDSGSKVYEIAGRFNPAASHRLAEWTEEHVGSRLVFVYDGEIVTSPIIKQKLEGGGFSIISVPLFTDRNKALEVYESLLPRK